MDPSKTMEDRLWLIFAVRLGAKVNQSVLIIIPVDDYI